MSEVYAPSGQVSATSTSRFTSAEAATGTFGTMDRATITELLDRTRYLDQTGQLQSALKAFIGDNANADVTLGLTINQGGADDQILALKSSDIAHGVSTVAETDTFAYFKKLHATNGGVNLTSFASSAGAALYLSPVITTATTTKSTSGIGAANVDAYLKSGTGVAVIGADGNLFTVGSNGTVRFIFDVEGSAHADVEWTTF